MSTFMQKQVIEAQYFRVNTSMGTEIVPCDDVGGGRTCSIHVEALLNYLQGEPDDADELCDIHDGWIARMSAPGYLDCTDWTAHSSEEAAYRYLENMYED